MISPASQGHHKLLTDNMEDSGCFLSRGHGFESLQGRRKARAIASLSEQECQVTI